MVHGALSIVNCRKVLSDALQEVLHLGLYGGKVAQLVADPDEGQVDVVAGKLWEQQVLVQPVGFADEAFGAVAVHCVLESAFRNGDEDDGGGEGCGLRGKGALPINGSQGIGRE